MLAAAAALAALVQAAPAQAALSGTNWTAQALPANYFIGGGGAPLSPVSCVPGTQFCVVIANDSAVTVNGFLIGQAALVSTDTGKSWTGHASLPSTFRVTAVSCVSASVCWASGTGWQDQPAVAKTADGGQTWTDMSPASWAFAGWWPNSIDCVSETTCWLAGLNWSESLPTVSETTDGGATWTTFTNLPTVATSPGATAQLNGISCISASSCLAVGGMNASNGTAIVFSTTDSGATWNQSTDPALSNVQQLFSVSCLLTASGSTTCVAAASALRAAGPVTLVSDDGGATWGRRRMFDNTGWLNSISCINTRHCWAAGSGTAVALVGTSNGGESWKKVTSDTTNQDGSVSCLSVSVCVAATDNGLWVKSDDGGLPGHPAL